MSRTFSIKNKRSFFGFKKAKIMQVDEITSIIDDLVIYEYPEDELNQLLTSTLDNFVCIKVGIEGKSGRTFEISYQKETNCYDIRVLTPSTSNDWQIAIDFTQRLAQKLGSTIIDEEEIEYASDNITYDYKNDILLGIHSLLERNAPTIFGVHHPFCLSQEQLDKIRNAQDKIATFDELVYENQYINAYFANQKFYQTEDDIIAIYVLTQETSTILPYKAEVEFLNLEFISNEQVNRWILHLMTFEDPDNFETYEKLGELEYTQFIEKLSKDKYRHIDEKYIVVDGLSKQDMINLLV